MSGSNNDSPLERIRSAYRRHLPLARDDEIVLDFVYAICAASKWGGVADPIWGKLVGVSGCGKTEMIRPLLKWGHTKILHALTTKTFVSSYQEKGLDHSILPTLDGKLVVNPEFTAFMDMNPRERDEIMGQMRAIYDGYFSKPSGANRGQIKVYRSKFFWLACVTPEVDRFLHDNQQLGQRFILIRMGRVRKTVRLREANAYDSIARMDTKEQWRKDLSEEVRAELKVIGKFSRRVEKITVRDEVIRAVVGLVDFLCRARTLPVHGAPVAPELSRRLSQQLVGVLKGRALADGRTVVRKRDLPLARRIASDTISPVMDRILRVLWKQNGKPVSFIDLRNRSRFPLYRQLTIGDIMKQYAFAGLVCVNKDRAAFHEDTLDQITRSGFYEPLNKEKGNNDTSTDD